MMTSQRPAVPQLLLQLMISIIHLRISSAYDAVPKFVEEPQSAIVQPGSAVELRCAVHWTSDDAMLHWTFNSHLLESTPAADADAGVKGQRRAASVAETETLEHRLHIGEFDASQHEGDYQCVMTSSTGAITSRPARLEPAVLGSFPPAIGHRRHVTPDDVTVVRGNMAAIRCDHVPFSRPPARVEYQLNGTRLMTSPRVAVQLSGNLHIADVTAADQGVYQCTAVNPVTGQRAVSPFATKLVVRDTPHHQIAATISRDRTTERLKAVLGGHLTLECVAHGWPVPLVHWQKYGGQLPVGRYSIELGSLKIRDVQKHDAGTYLCNANNSATASSTPPTRVVSVDVLESPGVEATVSTVNVTEGSSAVLRCRLSTSDDSITVHWLHNARFIDVSTAAGAASPTVMASQRETTLTLSDVRRHDSGIYQCVASNDLATAHASIIVHVTASSRLTQHIDGEDDNGVIDVSMTSQDGGDGDDVRDHVRHGNRHYSVGGRGAGILMSPSRPEVSGVTSSSVLVQWTMTSSPGVGSSAHVTSFRLQYKELTDDERFWQTVDDDIPPTWRSYEVVRLRTGRQYRFRVLALYSTGDSRASLLSAKIVFGAVQTPRPPPSLPHPVIVEVRALSLRELIISWQVDASSSTTPETVIEGFVIYYAPFDRDDSLYLKQIVHGTSVRHAVLSQLSPDTPYTVRMTSYGSWSTASAGDASDDEARRHSESEFSNSVVSSTLGESDRGDDAGNSREFEVLLGRHQAIQSVSSSTPAPVQPAAEAAGGDDDNVMMVGDGDNQLLYVVLGTVLGVVVLVVVICVGVCMCRQHRRQLNRRAAAALKAKQRQRQQQLAQNSFVTPCTSLLKSKMAPTSDDVTSGLMSHIPGCVGACSSGSDVGLMTSHYVNGPLQQQQGQQSSTLNRKKIAPSPMPLKSSASYTTSSSSAAAAAAAAALSAHLYDHQRDVILQSPSLVDRLMYNSGDLTSQHGGGRQLMTSYTPPPLPAPPVSGRGSSPDHIPRSHEQLRTPRPYWRVGPIRQALNDHRSASLPLAAAASPTPATGDVTGDVMMTCESGGEMKDQATNTDAVSECGTLSCLMYECGDQPPADDFSSSMSDVAMTTPPSGRPRDSFNTDDSPTSSDFFLFDSTSVSGSPAAAMSLHPPLPVTYFTDKPPAWR